MGGGEEGQILATSGMTIHVRTVAHPHLLKGTCKDISPFLLVDEDDDGRVDAAAKEGEQPLSLVCLRHHQHLLLHSLSWFACGRKRDGGTRSAEPELRSIQIVFTLQSEQNDVHQDCLQLVDMLPHTNAQLHTNAHPHTSRSNVHNSWPSQVGASHTLHSGRHGGGEHDSLAVLVLGGLNVQQHLLWILRLLRVRLHVAH